MESTGELNLTIQEEDEPDITKIILPSKRKEFQPKLEAAEEEPKITEVRKGRASKKKKRELYANLDVNRIVEKIKEL